MQIIGTTRIFYLLKDNTFIFHKPTGSLKFQSLTMFIIELQVLFHYTTEIFRLSTSIGLKLTRTSCSELLTSRPAMSIYEIYTQIENVTVTSAP